MSTCFDAMFQIFQLIWRIRCDHRAAVGTRLSVLYGHVHRLADPHDEWQNESFKGNLHY